MKKKIVNADGKHPDFIALVKLLDEYLAKINGDLQVLFAPHNTLAEIHDVILIYDGNLPVACGGFKYFDAATVELKRIFVREEYRRRGLSKEIIQDLEHIARYKGFKYAVVETGAVMQPAVALYQELGYQRIENYPPYVGNEHSICFQKELE